MTSTRILVCLVLGGLTVLSTSQLHAQALTFPEVWQRALNEQPRLKAAAGELRALQNELYQAARRPNPELDFELEDAFGSGPLAGTDAAETSAIISQRIERGGKRKARQILAQQHLDMNQLEFQRELVELHREARRRFVALLLTQQHAALTEQQVAVARQNLAAVRRLHEAAGAAVDEVSRAEMELRLAELRQQEIRRRMESARLSLAALWGGTGAGVNTANGKLLFYTPPGQLQTALAALSEGIDMAIWRARQKRQEAAFELERARGVADVTVSAGVKHMNGIDEYAMTLGASIPLQFFDDNRGNIRAARERLSVVAEGREAQLRELRNRVIEAYQSWSQAQISVERLESVILPQAQQLVRQTRQAYQQGRYTYLRVLDAQGALIDAQEQLLEAKGTAAEALTTLTRYLEPPPAGPDPLSPDVNGVE